MCGSELCTVVTILTGFVILECHALYEATLYTERYQNYSLLDQKVNTTPMPTLLYCYMLEYSEEEEEEKLLLDEWDDWMQNAYDSAWIT